MLTVVPKQARKHNFLIIFSEAACTSELQTTLFFSLLFYSFLDEIWVLSSASIAHVIFLQGKKQRTPYLSWKINEAEVIFIKCTSIFSYITLEFKLFFNPPFQNLSASLICLIFLAMYAFYIYIQAL